MKNKIQFACAALALAVMVFIASCTKEGAKGAAGVNGGNGKDGNANVKMQLFKNTDGSLVDSMSKNRFIINHTLNFTSNEIDSSLLLAYYQTDNYWFPLNDSRGDYRLSTYTSSGSGGIVLYTEMYAVSSGALYVSGTSKILMNKIKVILAPANGFSGKKDVVDYTDYKATMKYYGLPE